VRQRHFDAFHLVVAAFGRRLKIVNEQVKRYGLTDRLCAQLSEINKADIRRTGSMSPRAKAALAALRMGLRAATIARSFDIGHSLSSSEVCMPTAEGRPG